VVRAIDYENFGPVTVTEAQQALQQKEIELQVGGGWEPNRFKAARAPSDSACCRSWDAGRARVRADQRDSARIRGDHISGAR